MGITNVLNTGQTGMIAAKTAIATTGHNITNANSEGFSRQRVHTQSATPAGGNKGNYIIGSGANVTRIERINDEYVEKQIRNSQRDLSHYEEKELAFRQIEDVFNEINGDGLNRLISRFFNDFRKLANEPENPAIRQAVRESSQAMINDFHRIRKEVDDVGRHMDNRLEGYSNEVNSLIGEVEELNKKIRELELTGMSPNDLMDKRDLTIRKLGSFFDISTFKDRDGNTAVDLKNVGPLISVGSSNKLSVDRSPADDQGKQDNSLDLRIGGSVSTHQIRGGKIGALLESRDKTISTILERLDDLAFTITESVNEVHSQGFNLEGTTGINFFKPMNQVSRSAEFLSLSDEVASSINYIAAAAEEDAPGDNRIAIAISQLQHEKLLEEGYSSVDEFYNSIISDVGVASARNRFTMNQQRDIMAQLSNVRDQISGVSIDEETSNLLQYQHAFDAAAKIIQIADEMLKTILSLKRD